MQRAISGIGRRFATGVVLAAIVALLGAPAPDVGAVAGTGREPRSAIRVIHPEVLAADDGLARRVARLTQPW